MSHQWIKPIGMTDKRKRVVLCINDKLTILKRLEKGERASKLANEYGIGVQTVKDLKKREKQLNSFVTNSDSPGVVKRRKTLRKPKFEEVESALYKWFCQSRAEGIPVSGPMIIQKAKFFHSILGMEDNFTASSGWLTRFKQRHGIREITIRDEKTSTDTEVVLDFQEELRRFVCQQQQLGSSQLNVEKTNVSYKALPSKTLAAEKEYTVSEQETRNEAEKEITLICTPNALENVELVKVEEVEESVSEQDNNHAIFTTDKISHAEALYCLETLIDYFEQEGDKTFDEILQLQRYRSEIKKRNKL